MSCPLIPNGLHQSSGSRSSHWIQLALMASLSALPGLVSAADGTGLRGIYYPSLDYSGTPQTRIDSGVNFTWDASGPGLSGIPATKFSVSWKGWIEPQSTEVYTISLTSDDGALLLINGKVVIKNWTDHGPTENTATISLTQGVRYAIDLKYYQNTGGAVAKLQWSSPTITKQPIPASRLFPSIPTPLAIATDLASRTSPGWLEGVVSDASTKVEVKVGSASASVTRLGPARWYASNVASGQPLGIALSSTSPTAITVSSTEGGTIKTVTGALSWTVTDLANLPYGLEVVTIRPNDKLLFAVNKTGASVVELDTAYSGTTFKPVLSGTPASRFQVTYPNPGTYQVRGRCDGAEFGRITVIVAGIDFQGTTANEVGYQRLKDIKVLPSRTLAGALGYTASNPDIFLVGFKAETALGAQLTLMPLSMGNHVYHVRLHDDFGPILAQQSIAPFTLSTSAKTTIPIVEEYADGSWKGEAKLTMSPLIEGIDVKMRTFVSGVTFDDSTTSRTVSTTTFAKTGSVGGYLYWMLRAPDGHASFCHAYTAYQNSVQVSR